MTQGLHHAWLPPATSTTQRFDSEELADAALGFSTSLTPIRDTTSDPLTYSAKAIRHHMSKNRKPSGVELLTIPKALWIGSGIQFGYAIFPYPGDSRLNRFIAGSILGILGSALNNDRTAHQGEIDRVSSARTDRRYPMRFANHEVAQAAIMGIIQEPQAHGTQSPVGRALTYDLAANVTMREGIRQGVLPLPSNDQTAEDAIAVLDERIAIYDSALAEPLPVGYSLDDPAGFEYLSRIGLTVKKVAFADWTSATAQERHERNALGSSNRLAIA